MKVVNVIIRENRALTEKIRTNKQYYLSISSCGGPFLKISKMSQFFTLSYAASTLEIYLEPEKGAR